MIKLNDPDFDSPSSSQSRPEIETANWTVPVDAAIKNHGPAALPTPLHRGSLIATSPRVAFLAGLIASFLSLCTIGFFILLTLMS